MTDPSSFAAAPRSVRAPFARRLLFAGVLPALLALLMLPGVGPARAADAPPASAPTEAKAPAENGTNTEAPAVADAMANAPVRAEAVVQPAAPSPAEAAPKPAAPQEAEPATPNGTAPDTGDARATDGSTPDASGTAGAAGTPDGVAAGARMTGAGQPAAAEESEPLPGTPAEDPAVAQPDDKADQDGPSTLDLLNEDDRLENAGTESPDTGDTGDTAAEGTTEGTERTDGAEAAAAIQGPDGAAPQAGNAAPEAGDPFPTSPGIEQQKAFWIKIFTHYHSQQGVLHDGRIALPVYEDLELDGMSYRHQRRYVRHRKRELAAKLRELAAALKAGDSLSAEQQALRERLPTDSTPKDIREFAANVRFQRGLADRFKRGVERSGALAPYIKAALKRHNVPEDLMYLPHVESSYNNATRSKAGAVGIWQFTRGTGRIFMHVGYEVDERLDPIIASEAAARFLRQNYERLGNWPLAITAYNHGPRSLERIVARTGTRDLGKIIEDYDGWRFKFASKNFYAEFLAAREVAQHPEQYFGELEMESPLEFNEVDLPWYVSVKDAAAAAHASVRELRRLNPALRRMVWSDAKYIPAGYHLRIPDDRPPGRFIAGVPDDARHGKQKRSVYVRVARGDTLYSIGRRHGISWRLIALANNISSYRRLLPGTRLVLPWDGVTPPPAAIAKNDAKADGRDGGSPLDGEHVVAHIPVQRSAPWQDGMPQPENDEVIADQFQELRVVNVNPRTKEGEIIAAYGETVGKYAEWAGITPSELRHLNGMSWRSMLRPGQHYTVPLDTVSREEFEARRMEFHRQREQNFFAEYRITDKVKIQVRRGHSPWNIAQENNVPMWLFYKENPKLLTEPLRVGMQVILPIVHAGGTAAR